MITYSLYLQEYNAEVYQKNKYILLSIYNLFVCLSIYLSTYF